MEDSRHVQFRFGDHGRRERERERDGEKGGKNRGKEFSGKRVRRAGRGSLKFQLASLLRPLLLRTRTRVSWTFFSNFLSFSFPCDPDSKR